MALSGSFYRNFIDNTVVFSGNWTAKLDAVTNTAAITITLYYDTTARSAINCPTINGDKASAYAIIGGERVYFDVPTMSGSKKHLIGTKTINSVPLNDEKTTPFELSCTLHFGEQKKFYESLLSTNYTAISSVEASTGTKYLDAVMRTSYIDSVSGDKVLGVAHNYIVNKAADEFTHTIEYSRGEHSGVICVQSPDVVVPVTLPKELALESTESATFKITLKVTTYLGDVKLKESTTEELYEVSADCHPTCSISIADGERLLDKYGGYIQGQSRFVITTTPTLAYNSPVASFLVLANDEKLTAEISTSSVLRNSGTQTIVATVTDTRGITSPEASATIDVVPWEKPRVTELRTARCDENGELTSSGEYLKVTFDAEISPINNKNSAKYVINYQKTSGIDNHFRELTDYEGQYSVTGGVYIFAAEKNTSYAVSITAYDDFNEGTRSTGGATAVVLMNLLASGLGLCFGNIATLDNVCEIAFRTYASGGYIHPKLEASDLSFVKTPNTYYCDDPQDIDGCPTDEPFVLKVYPIDASGNLIIVDEDDADTRNVMQEIITAPINSATPVEIWVRHIRRSEWSSWYNIVTGETKVVI